ncbi:MAG TPA: CatB-related O-acetyltransferase [Solirubrobacteraceae bacterium]|jgi:acetyltransferase-like isoleucine patch superfamily enzyme|nr:CatB-related O-acetyltransferase [Solirubrobacteraceae bacterium]
MIETLRYAYHVVRNVRVALRNALLGKLYAEFRYQQKKGRVIFGPGSYGFPEVKTFDLGTECLRVGNYSSLNGTYLLGGMHGVDRVTTYPLRINWRMEGAGVIDGIPIPQGDTIVGSDVWSCDRCLILSGLTIGDGAIIAAGAVVTKDVPPFAIVGGNPARLIRYRFSEEQIAALLEIRWWDWPEEQIRAAVDLLAGDDVEAFIAYARRGAAAGAGAPPGGRSTASSGSVARQ